MVGRSLKAVVAADKRLAYRWLLALGAFLALFILLAVDFSPRTITGLEISKPSPVTVKAPRKITLIDVDTTQQLREQAAAEVQPVYRYDVDSPGEVRAKIKNRFQRLSRKLFADDLSTKEKRQAAIDVLPTGASGEEIDWLLSQSRERVGELRAETIEIASVIMTDKIKTEDVDGKREEARRRATALEDLFAGHLVGSIAADTISANNFVDRRQTNEAIATAVDLIQPVMTTKLSGEMIVREGEIVTTLQEQFLDELGLTADIMGKTARQTIGEGIISFVLLLLGSIYLREFQPRVYRDNRLLLMLAVILGIISLLARGLAPLFPPFAIPIAGAAMLTTILVRPTAGIMMAITSAIITGIIVNDPQYWIFAFMTGLFAVYLTSNISHRSDLTRAGLWLMLATGVTAVAAGMIADEPAVNLVLGAGWAVVGGFGAIVLTIGILQFLEYAFNISTDLKLLELSNPTQPLLRELMVNAPGTYNHSIITGNLVEGVAPQVGANPLLARAGAYYHDIGKIRRPFFFVENQYGDNPHDKTQPHLSYLVISAHVKEGVEMARKKRLPEEIIDIISQHHGTTLVSYFYNRAKETETNSSVTESQFRYQGEKPATKEAALIMLADAVEAAARALSKPTSNKIEQMVRKIVKDRVYDGQLDESDLTLRDIETVITGYAHALTTMYHSRIEYPDIEKPSKKRGVVVGSFGKKSVGSPGKNLRA